MRDSSWDDWVWLTGCKQIHELNIELAPHPSTHPPTHPSPLPPSTLRRRHWHCARSLITSDVTDAFDTVGLTEILNSYFDGRHVISRVADVQMATVRLTFLLCVMPGDSCVAHVDATPRLHAEHVVCWTVVCKHKGQFGFLLDMSPVVCKHNGQFRFLLDSGLQTKRSV